MCKIFLSFSSEIALGFCFLSLLPFDFDVAIDKVIISLSKYKTCLFLHQRTEFMHLHSGGSEDQQIVNHC